MSRHPQLYQWMDTVVMRFPLLSKPQALGLALWSFGMVIARSDSLTTVADMLAQLMGQSYNKLRERLRDIYRDAGLKQFNDLPPIGWTVIVLADRGLYAKWLFEAIVEPKWHPFLRVNSQGKFRREGWCHWKPR